MSISDDLRLSWTPDPHEWAIADLERRQLSGPRVERPLLALLFALLSVPLLMSDDIAAGLVISGCALLLATKRSTPAMASRGWARIFARTPGLSDNTEARFDETGVWVRQGLVETTRPWSTFTAWWDTRRAVVLCTGDQTKGPIMVVPTSDPSRGDELRSMLAAHLGPKSGAAPSRARRVWLNRAAPAFVVSMVAVPLLHHFF